MQKTKRVVSLLLAVMLVFTCFTCLASVTAYAADDEEPTADTFVVAGTPADIFGTAWDATNEANLMTANEDGTYTKEYTVDKAFDVVQLKAVKNGSEWYGDETGNNVTFALTGAGTFTVTAAPAEEGYAVSVSGDNVGEVKFEVGTVFAVGNGEGTWLNGAAWDPGFASNEMTEVEKDVWEISFENVPDGFSRQIKFAIDGAWTYNFGGAFVESGVETDAVYSGDNITFDTDDTCTVTARLDLREFDFAAKTGAKYTITVKYDTFVVAGTPADIFGTAWDATNEANLMTANEDGTYTKEYTVDKAFDVVQLKAVKNGSEWYGDETGNNVTFALTGAGTFTVTAAPAEEGYAVSVSGDNVGEVKFEVGTVFAVGNGEGTWLNGAAWDPGFASNEMTEVEKDVWEISFENVPDGFERQIKFAVDGTWTHNFGAPKEDVPEFESGVTFDATYDGGNITFDTDDTCTVTAQLDLREFDFVNKTGAKYTITVKYDTFVVAGTPADIFGTAWDATNEANLMTANEDGTYTKEYTVDKAFDVVQLKAVKNGSEWYGDETGNNVTFALTGAGTFTVTAAPAEEGYAVSVSGDNVGEVKFEVGTVFAVGNGEGTWLNGAAWDPGFASNEMTEVEKDVWEISFENVPDGFERQIKFAVDGTWTHNFGAPKEDVPEFESGVTFDATYDGGNITFDTDDTCTVTAQLDLREFDFVNKTGAKYTITITYGGGFVYGDVDGDGQVRINDATLLQRHMIEQEGYVLDKDSDAFKAGDVDGDGEITIEDVTLIQRYLAQFITKFPVEE